MGSSQPGGCLTVLSWFPQQDPPLRFRCGYQPWEQAVWGGGGDGEWSPWRCDEEWLTPACHLTCLCAARGLGMFTRVKTHVHHLNQESHKCTVVFLYFLYDCYSVDHEKELARHALTIFWACFVRCRLSSRGAVLSLLDLWKLWHLLERKESYSIAFPHLCEQTKFFSCFLRISIEKTNIKPTEKITFTLAVPG